jgi:hypothetical protein
VEVTGFGGTVTMKVQAAPTEKWVILVWREGLERHGAINRHRIDICIPGRVTARRHHPYNGKSPRRGARGSLQEGNEFRFGWSRSMPAGGLSPSLPGPRIRRLSPSILCLGVTFACHIEEIVTLFE